MATSCELRLLPRFLLRALDEAGLPRPTCPAALGTLTRLARAPVCTMFVPPHQPSPVWPHGPDHTQYAYLQSVWATLQRIPTELPNGVQISLPRLASVRRDPSMRVRPPSLDLCYARRGHLPNHHVLLADRPMPVVSEAERRFLGTQSLCRTTWSILAFTPQQRQATLHDGHCQT